MRQDFRLLRHAPLRYDERGVVVRFSLKNRIAVLEQRDVERV
jgi:hypothetical protein